MNIQSNSNNSHSDISDMHPFKWLGLLLLLCLLGYLGSRAYIVNSNMHAYSKHDTYFIYAFKATEPLLRQANALAKTQPALAKKQLNQAYRTDFTSAMPLILMAQQYQSQNQTEKAQQLLNLGEQINPKHTQFQLALGQFWGAQQRFDRAFLHWSQALNSRPSLGKKLFPVFLTMAESAQFQPLFFQKQAHVPQWLDGFFSYALQHATAVDTVRHLAKQYPLYGQTMPANIKLAYLDKLMQAELWTEAYFDWLNGLNPKQLAVLGNVNDGGFEADFPSDGFAWRYASTKGIQLSQANTFGMTGQGALRVQFLGSAVGATQLAEQKLMLSPASYQLSGRIRAEQLHLFKGAHWQVSCQQGTVLAKTAYFQQDTAWADFKVDLTVPTKGCSGQVLQLVLEHALDREQTGMYGTLWFDDFEIKRMNVALPNEDEVP